MNYTYYTFNIVDEGSVWFSNNVQYNQSVFFSLEAIAEYFPDPWIFLNLSEI